MTIDFRRSGRVLYMSSADISVGNGPGVNEREFVVALHAAMGPRAHFLLPRPLDEVPELPAPVRTYSRPHDRHHVLRYPLHIISQMLLAKRLLSRERFDLLVFRLDILPLAAARISRKNCPPYALKTLGQNTLKVLSAQGGVLGRLLSGVNHRLVRQLVREALVADSVSPLQVDFLREQLDVPAGKILWIDNAVNTNRFFPSSTVDAREKLGLSRFDRVVGYVGTRPWERGGLQLIEAAPRLLRTHPRLGVLILGDGPELKSLQQRARDLGVERHCVFAGYVPFESVPTYINSMDVGVSINLREERQASSELKVRQYVACGKPVVASPGGNDFLTRFNLGSIVPPADIGAIAAELDSWLRLGDCRNREFARRACHYARQHLSMQRAVDRRLEIWAERLNSLKTVNNSQPTPEVIQLAAKV